jgi:hypothetical protein
MHWRTYYRLFNKAAAAQARWSALKRDYLRPRFPDALLNENVVGRQPLSLTALRPGGRDA